VFPKAAPLIETNMFMDDFVAGAEDVNGATSIYYELTALMKTINYQWQNRLPAAKN
jgi:hypothetical protein